MTFLACGSVADLRCLRKGGWWQYWSVDACMHRVSKPSIDRISRLWRRRRPLTRFRVLPIRS
jgi:hypothetical protein